MTFVSVSQDFQTGKLKGPLTIQRHTSLDKHLTVMNKNQGQQQHEVNRSETTHDINTSVL